jgi:threonine/homoserine/homoserine lactone efflux protein
MVPKGLRFWFVVHFVLDVIFAIPLLLFPKETLQFFGWTQIDPLATRLVGAALMGIGVESLLGRNATTEAFRAMLNLKVIWSLSAVFGITLSMVQGGPPVFGWAVLAIFGSFSILWISYRLRLSHHRAK